MQSKLKPQFHDIYLEIQSYARPLTCHTRKKCREKGTSEFVEPLCMVFLYINQQWNGNTKKYTFLILLCNIFACRSICFNCAQYTKTCGNILKQIFQGKIHYWRQTNTTMTKFSGFYSLVRMGKCIKRIIFNKLSSEITLWIMVDTHPITS